uniref:Neogenin C-terminal domain-containing protein n=1 Tax=Strongyloides stercoralis TaxID=6248 RepID=A0A0K0EHN2_STRER
MKKTFIKLSTHIIDEIPIEDNISKNFNFTSKSSLFGDCRKIENTINESNFNQNRVYNSSNSLFENCKKNDEDLDANDFEDYPMEHVNNQIYLTDENNKSSQVVPSNITSTSNPTYIKVNSENVNRKRSNPSNRSSNIHQPQSSPPSLSRVTSAKPYYRQSLPQSTVASKTTRYNNSSFNSDGFQICASNVKPTQNFDLEKELKEIDEMNDAIDKLF